VRIQPNTYSSARGNTTLESAVTLTKELRWGIQEIGQSLENAVTQEDSARQGSSKAQSQVQNMLQLKRIVVDLKRLLTQIEDAVPLINLAITTSGASLSTTLPPTISPSRLLQASTFLTAGDTQYSMSNSSTVQVGPTFTLSLYMLFAGHVRPHSEDEVRASTWKEVIHKARVKLIRVPISATYDLPKGEEDRTLISGLVGDAVNKLEAAVKAEEYAYQLVIVEDFDDDRVHSFADDEPQPERYDDVTLAGIREPLPVHEISKIFYADTGKILNIGSDDDAHHPVLLLKRDLHAPPPRRMMERPDNDFYSEIEPGALVSPSPAEKRADPIQARIDAQIHKESRRSSVAVVEEPQPASKTWRLPPDLDPEWLALEVYTETEDSDDDSETPAAIASRPAASRSQSLDPQLLSSLADANLKDSPTSSPSHNSEYIRVATPPSIHRTTPWMPTVRTSLSLLEMLLRLTSLQQFQQTSHLSISDEFLNFFLSEAATTGAAAGDEHERRRVREEARRRVGFDPYDESPVKRRGEDYQYRGGSSQVGWGADEGRYEDGEGEGTTQPDLVRSIENDATRPSYSRDSGNISRRLGNSSPGLRRQQSATPDVPPLYSRAQRPGSSTSGIGAGSSPPPLSRSSDTPGTPRTPSPVIRRGTAQARLVQVKSENWERKGSPLSGLSS